MNYSQIIFSKQAWTKMALVLGIIMSLSIVAIARADTAPTVTSTIQDTTNATIASAGIGAVVHDSVTIADPTGTTTPSGTVDFNLYATTDCSGTPTTQPGVALTSGMAASATTTVPNTGLSYKVHYNGQTGVYAAADGACEPLSALKFAPTVGTTIRDTADAAITSATVGAVVHDRASVTGTGPAPTGTVGFTFYTNNSCESAGTASGTGLSLTSGIATSTTQGPLSPGQYSFKAHYSGDANYSAKDAQCEPLAIGMTAPTLATTLSATSTLAGTSIHDSATLSGSTADSSGSVAYKVFTDNACSTLMQSAGTKTVSSSTIPDSDAVLFSTPGTYYWQAHYSGDADNASATSTCGSEILTVLATTTPPTTGTISGEKFNDLNGNGIKDAGEPGIQGWKIRLIKLPRFLGFFPWFSRVQTATTDANGNYSFTNLSPGTYIVREAHKDGWEQMTPNPARIVITGGSVIEHIDFGNMQENEGDENENNDHGQATSSANHADEHDNGLHVGWTIGKGNQNSDKHPK